MPVSEEALAAVALATEPAIIAIRHSFAIANQKLISTAVETSVGSGT